MASAERPRSQFGFWAFCIWAVLRGPNSLCCLNDTRRRRSEKQLRGVPSSDASEVRAIETHANAVDEIGDRDAEAAADDETASAVKHPNGLDNPDKLQTESHHTVSALPLKNEQHAQNEKAEPQEEHEPGKQQVEQE